MSPGILGPSGEPKKKVRQLHWSIDPSISSYPSYILQRPITPTDWSRPIFYATRVKSLDFTCKDDSEFSEIFPTLSLCFPRDLFPNLTTLECDSTWTDFLGFFLTPTVITVSFSIEPSTTHLSLLSTLVQRCPKLEDTSLSVLQSSPAADYAISAFLRSLGGIESLSLYKECLLDVTALVRIGRIATLTSLLLEALPDAIPSLAPPESNLGFLNLRELWLSVTTIKQATAFFGLCSQIPLHSLNISFDECLIHDVRILHRPRSILLACIPYVPPARESLPGIVVPHGLPEKPTLTLDRRH
ncbi:hypothetical protein C8R44DRAFT_732794 [Mycena epipterygia]|nr:hypothetical protein C8R44DRAFT_732794 [Mycena epipterygia]